MINIATIEQKLAPQALDMDERPVLEVVLPRLGPRMGKWLEERVNNRSFQDEWHSIFVTLLAVGDMLDALSFPDGSETITDYLHRSLADEDYGLGDNFLPFVLDLKEMSKSKVQLSSDVVRVLFEFELEMFEDLPQEEAASFLKYSLLWLATKTDLIARFREMRENSVFGELSDWPKPYIAAFSSNTETIGNQALIMDNKQVQPLVSNWIKDFVASISKPTNNRTAVDVVQYLEKSKNARTLSKQDRDLLLQILKLYAWMTNPEVFFSEVGTELDEDISVPNPLVQRGSPTVAIPSTSQDKIVVPEVSRPIDTKHAINIQEQLMAGSRELPSGQVVPLPAPRPNPVLKQQVVAPPPPQPLPAAPTPPPIKVVLKPADEVPVNPAPIVPKPAASLHLKPDIAVPPQGRSAVNIQALINSERPVGVRGAADISAIPKGVALGGLGSTLDMEKVKKEMAEKQKDVGGDSKDSGSEQSKQTRNPPTSSES